MRIAAVAFVPRNAASAPLTIPFNHGITEAHTCKDWLQQTGVSAGNLLFLNF